MMWTISAMYCWEAPKQVYFKLQLILKTKLSCGIDIYEFCVTEKFSEGKKRQSSTPPQKDLSGLQLWYRIPLSKLGEGILKLTKIYLLWKLAAICHPTQTAVFSFQEGIGKVAWMEKPFHSNRFVALLMFKQLLSPLCSPWVSLDLGRNILWLVRLNQCLNFSILCSYITAEVSECLFHLTSK